jgi:nucleotide-binding universal stress UspA family protein
VEAAIFDTGRPTLLLPSGRGRKALNWLDKVVVAFDYGREAARALNDSLSLLTRAKEVHVVCITGEKDFHTTCSRADLEKYFTAQGISPVIETAPANGGIVAALNDYASAEDADLLVMGAYGHTRIREFILGGATAGILGDPKLPVLMSR